MKKYLLFCTLAASSFFVTAQTSDPVIMTVDGKDIKKTEFEYIFNKNNNETSIDKKSLDEYLVLFKNFKLKVAEAEALGLDTTETFHKEFKEYRSLLAKPYLSEWKKDETEIKRAYSYLPDLVDVSYLVVPVNDMSTFNGQMFPADTLETYKKMKSICKEYAKGAKFEDLVVKYSADTRTAQLSRPGHVGWNSAQHLHPLFAERIFETKVGEISEPIHIGNAYHLFRINGRKPNPGQVNASHILILCQDNASPKEKAEAGKRINDLYDQAIEGADFGQLATEFSEDKGSAQNGGNLGWFDSGRMVPEFDEAVFSMNTIGEVCKPIKTTYGYHIIKLLDKRPFDLKYDDVKGELESQLNRFGYRFEILSPTINRLKEEHNYQLNETSYNALLKEALTVHPSDSLFYTKFEDNKDELFKVDGQSYSVSDFVTYVSSNPKTPYLISTEVLQHIFNEYEFNALVNAEDKILEDKYPEFRNLVQEYRDGILLFEISNQKVWERSSSDIEGLETFFAKNKNKYAWSDPHYKGYVVLAKDKKMQKKMRKEIKKMEPDSAAQYLVDNYKVGDVTYVRLERGLWIKGDNQYVDEAIFNTGKATLPEGYSSFFVIGKLLPDMPESYTDVRGQVITDYQDYLEQEWLKELNSKYPVSVNKEVLKTVK